VAKETVHGVGRKMPRRREQHHWRCQAGQQGQRRQSHGGPLESVHTRSRWAGGLRARAMSTPFEPTRRATPYARFAGLDIVVRRTRSPGAPGSPLRSSDGVCQGHGRREPAWLGPGGDGHQLGRRVRPCLGDHLPRWQGDRLAAAWVRGSNPPSPRSSVRGRRCECPLTWDSCIPAVTARARPGPAVSDAVRTQRGPGGVPLAPDRYSEESEWLQGCVAVPGSGGRHRACSGKASRPRHVAAAHDSVASRVRPGQRRGRAGSLAQG
jgi:hypothetical protein